jgi:septal ring factor EnvC (AmiA/AmiB activator)
MKNNTTKLLLVFVIILLIAVIYLIVQLQGKKEEVKEAEIKIEEKDTEIESKTKELESLAQELERIKSERDNLGLQNDSLIINIEKLNKAIKDIKKSKKLDEAKKAELNKLISQLREEIIAKDKEILELKSLNDSLATSVKYISNEKSKLADSLDRVQSQRKDVESQLAYASILKAEDIKVVGVKSNGKEFEDKEYKASKLDRFRVKFRIADNKAAKKGTREFYVRLKTPDGDVFTDPINGGGYFNLSDGTPLTYTLMAKAEFNNQNEQIELTSFAGLKFVPGFYKIEIYSDGNIIGETTFKVK